MTGFEIWAPDSVICNNVAHDNDAGGIAVGGQNSIVIANIAYNNGRAHAGFGGFAARVNPNRGASASHSIFIGNLAYDSRYPSHNATQDYGYVEQDATHDYGPVGQAAEITEIKHLEMITTVIRLVRLTLIALAVRQTFRKFKQMTRLGCRFRPPLKIS